MGRRPLSSVDTVWLRMEDPTNLMMISGIMLFGAPMDEERLRATLNQLVFRFRRFRQRVVKPSSRFGSAHWEDDDCFSLDNHLILATLPHPADQEALRQFTSELASTPLDFDRPLWQFHLVQDYQGGSALICRLHHCIGDGLALVHVLLSITSTDPDATMPELPKEADQAGAAVVSHPWRRVRQTMRETRRFKMRLVRQGFDTLIHPSRLVDMAQMAGEAAKSTARLIFRWPDPKTAFKGPLQVPKQTAWTEPIPLEDVKLVGRELGGTVNDVLLTAMAGSLRRYLEGEDKPVDGLRFRAIVPVNLRPLEDEPRLGNRFGLVFLSLPIGIADQVERLAAVRAAMGDLKDSLEASVAFAILSILGLVPAALQDIVIDIFGTKGTTVMTNVFGPQEELYLAGAPLEGLMFWVPQSGRLGMGISILSYDGKVWMGVITDEGLVPDPEEIIAGFHAEFDDLLALARKAMETPSLQEIAVRIDALTAAVDELLEERRPSHREETTSPRATEAETPSPVTSDEPERCQAQTKAGARCKNRALSGSTLCRVHQG